MTGATRHSFSLTVNMKNSDTIRARQTHHFHTTPTYTYTPEDAPMNTTEELQALLEEIGCTAESDAEINIHLPPVAYEEELVLNRRAVNLCGSLDQTGGRTTFTGPVHLTYFSGAVSFFADIEFTGSGGTGVSASSRLHLTNCRFSGWDTAVFCSETAWVNTGQYIFSDNGADFYINNAEPNISDSRFEGNTFQGSQTAVLLEQVGVETLLKFPCTRFSGNGTDIDNRCSQELELDRTVFQYPSIQTAPGVNVASGASPFCRFLQFPVQRGVAPGPVGIGLINAEHLGQVLRLHILPALGLLESLGKAIHIKGGILQPDPCFPGHRSGAGLSGGGR